MNENNNRIITPSADDAEAVKKMQHTATLSLAIILGQMWQEHKRVDSQDKPVEFAISLRGMDDVDGGPQRTALFRAEALWLQKVNGEDKTFHAHGPAFGTQQLNEGINITAMFRSLVDGIKEKQAAIEKGE